MKAVKAFKTVSIVGDCQSIKKELTTPFCKNGNNCRFYYKNIVYKITDLENAQLNIVVVSALDFLWSFSKVVSLAASTKTILYITDYACLKRLGFRLNRKQIEFMLACPVVFSTNHSSRGINRLLFCLNLLATTPTYTTAYLYPNQSKSLILIHKTNKLKNMLSKLFRL